VEKVLVNLRDVTEVRQLQLRAAQHEEDLKILIELIQIPEDRFHRFLHKTKEYLKQNRELVLQFEESRPDVIKQLFVNIHTIKGTARTYLLRSISSATHEVEEYYHLLAQGQNVWNKTVLLADISRIEELIERYRSVGEEKLGWQLTERLIKMSSSTLESVLASLNEIASEHLNPHQTSLVKSVRSLLFSVGFVSIQDVIDEACRGLDSVARDLEKLKPRFDVELPLVVMRDQGVNLMHGILVHLLRNSMDHGIERPAQRLLVGKQEAGIIYVHAVIRDKRLHIEYGDDGGGLNIEAIKQKAISRNLIKSDAPMTPQSIANLIFEAGLSTKSTVSDISGRGVGLDAVKRYLEEAGGSISIVLAKVEDVQQVPFRFVLEIPDAYFIPVEPNEKSKAS
jgi:chemotaxis protein histidine kinase CheA